MEHYGVYVYVDGQGRVTAINSDAFLADLTGWVQIDEGVGDRYHHAQGNYLDGPLTDERGVWRYNLEDGEIIERTQAEMDADWVPPVPYVSETERIATIAFVALAEAGSIDPVTASEHAEAFGEWLPGVAYEAGQLRRCGDKLYRCVQAHTSQDDWRPDATPALWTLAADPAEEWPEWAQPIGAHDAYQQGDKVTHGGRRWVSTVANNVWEPGVYGWEVSA